MNNWSLRKYINPLCVLSWFVDRIVANSDSILENCLNRGVNKNRVVRIYNGTEIDKFEKAVGNGYIRREFSIPDGFKIVSVIKDARPEVGLSDLLLSIPNILRSFPEVVFLIVGGGVETERLQSLANQLGIENKVIFTGIRDDIPEIISESFFTVDPSPVEAFGFVIIESMAGEKPVVAVNSWGPKEIILHGETGLLVEAGNPTDFAPAIIEMLNSPEKVKLMGEKGYERVKKHFTLDGMSKETADLSMLCLQKQ
jgi:glycosyltransferase involved in cell wall biosynthesis